MRLPGHHMNGYDEDLLEITCRSYDCHKYGHHTAAAVRQSLAAVFVQNRQ